MQEDNNRCVLPVSPEARGNPVCGGGGGTPRLKLHRDGNGFWHKGTNVTEGIQTPRVLSGVTGKIV